MLRVGIVGLGSWGRRLVESVQGKSDKVVFATAVSRSPDRIKFFCDKHGMTATDELSEMLGDKTIQAVVSAGPAGLHAQYGLAALEAGKHALVIKPFATKRADAEAVRAAAKKTGLVAVLGYNRCFQPPVNELRKRVAAGALGTLLHAEGNFCVDRYGHFTPGDWKSDRDQVLPGSLADHMLYGLIELLGPVAEVHAHGASHTLSMPIAATTAVLLRFQNGTSGLLTAIGVTPEYYRLAVFGTKGWIELRGNDEFTFQPKEGEAEVIKYAKFDAERAELEAFADAVAGTKPFPYSLDNAVHSAAVLEAMGQSAKSGKPVAMA
jgi:predicted dehydrogenase